MQHVILLIWPVRIKRHELDACIIANIFNLHISLLATRLGIRGVVQFYEQQEVIVFIKDTKVNITIEFILPLIFTGLLNN
jgi:hypothetical protein